MSDIRKWFIKKHDKESNAEDMKPMKHEKPPTSASASKAAAKLPSQESQGNSGRRKTSKYFAANTSEPTINQVVSNGSRIEKPSSKRRMNKIDDADINDDDFVPSSVAKKPAKVSPAKKLKIDTIRGVSQKPTDPEDDSDHDGATETPAKGSGRGTGGRGAGSSAGGRGRGFGRGGFMNFGERKDPPHKGEKSPAIFFGVVV